MLTTIAVVLMLLGWVVLTIVIVLRLHFHRNTFVLAENLLKVIFVALVGKDVTIVTEVSLVILTILDRLIAA